MKRSAQIALILPALVFVQVAFAGTAASGQPTLLLNEQHYHPSTFAAAAQDIRAGLADGGHYSDLSSAQKQRVLGLLERMHAVIEEDRPSAANVAQRLALRINKVLAPMVASEANPDSEMICGRHPQVGSRIPVTKCLTREEFEQERVSARLMLEERGIPAPPMDPSSAQFSRRGQ